MLAALAVIGGCTSRVRLWDRRVLPAMADVAGVRYTVAGAVQLVGVESQMVPYGVMTGASAYFRETTAYSLPGIDPSIMLIGRNQVTQDDPGPYRELWNRANNPFPVAYCAYMESSRRDTTAECPET